MDGFEKIVCKNLIIGNFLNCLKKKKRKKKRSRIYSFSKPFGNATMLSLFSFPEREDREMEGVSALE
jgi:hypothetical protein